MWRDQKACEMKVKKTTLIRRRIGFLLFVTAAILNLYPLLFTILCSFKGNLEIFKSFTALPTQLRFDNYVTAWSVGNIGRYFFNTLVLAASTLLVSAIVGALAAYILSKFNFKGRQMVYFFFLGGLMIPIQAVLIPLSYLFGKLGIMNNYPMLCLLYSAFCIPMTVLILTGLMKGIPSELEEATIMDGGSAIQTFLHVILPLSIPGIISASIFNFIQVWNNLLFPLIFITDKRLGTISMGLLSFFGEFSTNYSASMAGISLTTIPVILLYVLFQEKIENGLISGALKG